MNDAYFFPFSDQLLQWSSPVNNRLLLEAGIWHHQETWGGSISPFNLADPLAIGVTDNNPHDADARLHAADHTTITGASASAYTPSHNPNTRTNFAASYVTGSHAFKTGIDFALGRARRLDRLDRAVQLRRQSRSPPTARVGIPVPHDAEPAHRRLHRSAGSRMVNGGLTTPDDHLQSRASSVRRS